MFVLIGLVGCSVASQDFVLVLEVASPGNARAVEAIDEVDRVDSACWRETV